MRIAALEKKTVADGFWNDADKARRTLKEIASAKFWVDQVSALESRREDAQTLTELAAEEKDEASAKEASAEAESLAADVDRFAFKSLLSGEDDPNDCLVTIHSGAGGTEWCDGAEMLLRM